MSFRRILINIWLYPIGLFIAMYAIGNERFNMDIDYYNYFKSATLTMACISVPVTVCIFYDKIKNITKNDND